MQTSDTPSHEILLPIMKRNIDNTKLFILNKNNKNSMVFTAILYYDIQQNGYKSL